MRPAILLLLALLLAACADETRPNGEALSVATLTEGTYLLEHPGGTLRIASTGNWTLFTPQDDPSAMGNESIPFEDVLAAGGWVVWVHDGEARLSWPAPDPARPHLPLLPTHVERHVVVWRETAILPHVPVLLRDPLPPTTRHVELQRPAQLLSVRAAGSHEGLQVDVSGPHGTMDAHGNGYVLVPPVMLALSSEGWPGASRSLEVTAEAEHLGGPVVLEAWSYSRAAPSPPPPVGTPQGFLYGEVTGTPVRFDVHPEARNLTFSADTDSTVALWDGAGRRVATFDVAGGTAATVPVAGGPHIAVAWGRAALWAAVAPADLDLHPMPVRTHGASTHAGNGTYTTREYDVAADGVLYDVLAWSDPQRLDCWPGSARVLQGEAGSEEVVAYVMDFGDTQAGPFLGRVPGPVKVEVEGPGDCFQLTFQARYFVL